MCWQCTPSSHKHIKIFLFKCNILTLPGNLHSFVFHHFYHTMKSQRFKMEVIQKQRNRHQETPFSGHLNNLQLHSISGKFLPQYTWWEFESRPPDFSLGLRPPLNYLLVIGIFYYIKPSSIYTTSIYFFWVKQRG